MTIEHALKCDPESFDFLDAGYKTCEIRKDDRGYQMGHILKFEKTRYSAEEMEDGEPLQYTGHVIRFRITHIQRGFGIRNGYVALSLSRT